MELEAEIIRNDRLLNGEDEILDEMEEEDTVDLNDFQRRMLLVQPQKIDLRESNMKFREKMFNVETSFVSELRKWVAQKEYSKETLKDFDNMELELVQLMNRWCAILDFEKKDQIVAVRVLKGQKFHIMLKTTQGFLDLCKTLEVTTYNKEDFKHAFAYNPDRTQLRQHLDLNPWSPYIMRWQDENKRNKFLRKIRVNPMSIGKIWLDHPCAHKYHHIVFNPRPSNFVQAATVHELNSWSGFDFERDHVLTYTNWEKIRLFVLHVRYGMCDSDEEFVKFFSWMASLLQRPWLKQEVCFALGGPQGAGKSSVIQVLIKLIGDIHAGEVHGEEDVFGQFTDALENKILLLCDEWKLPTLNGAEEAFKNLITAKKQRIRKMYSPVEYQESFTNIVICSNNITKFFNAQPNDRRMNALHVDISELMKHPFMEELFQKDSKAYFDQMHADLACNDNAGYKTLANVLYNITLDGWNPRKTIITDLLAIQKKKSAPMEVQFWLECLISGKNTILEGEGYNGWDNHLSCRSFYQYYRNHCNEKNCRKVLNESDLFRQLSIYFPSQNDPDESSFRFVTDFPPDCENENKFSLEECRRYMETQFPGFSRLLQPRKDPRENKRKRVEALTEDDILFGFFPEEFNSEKYLMTKMWQNQFKVYKEDEFAKYDEEKCGPIMLKNPKNRHAESLLRQKADSNRERIIMEKGEKRKEAERAEREKKRQETNSRYEAMNRSKQSSITHFLDNPPPGTLHCEKCKSLDVEEEEREEPMFGSPNHRNRYYMCLKCGELWN